MVMRQASGGWGAIPCGEGDRPRFYSCCVGREREYTHMRTHIVVQCGVLRGGEGEGEGGMRDA